MNTEMKLQNSDYTILMVDDEVNVIRSLKRLFRKERYKIITAGSANEGLEIVQSNSIDVIISDQRMPGMSGLEFLSRVRKDFPRIIRMILSGYTDVQTVTDAINEGNVYKFILKPWDDNNLLDAVHEALRLRILQDENENLNEEIRKKNEELVNINRNLESEVRKRTNKIIAQSEDLKMAGDILDSIPVAVVCADINRKILFTNSFANILFSFETENIIGTFIKTIFNDDVLDVFDATINIGLPQRCFRNETRSLQIWSKVDADYLRGRNIHGYIVILRAGIKKELKCRTYIRRGFPKKKILKLLVLMNLK